METNNQHGAETNCALQKYSSRSHMVKIGETRRHHRLSRGPYNGLVHKTTKELKQGEQVTNIYAEGLSFAERAQWTTLSRKKNLQLRFVGVFSDTVDCYILQWDTQDKTTINKTTNYYKSIGLGIMILKPSYLDWIQWGGKLQEPHCHHTLNGIPSSIQQKQKVFQFIRLILVHSSFDDYKFNTNDIKDILRLNGAEILEVRKWTDLIPQNLSTLLRNQSCNGDSRRIITNFVHWDVKGKQSIFNDLLQCLGIVSVHVQYFLRCIETQQMEVLNEDYKLLKS